MNKTKFIVENTRKALKEFIAYEVRLIYACKYVDELNHRDNGNDAASVTIHENYPNFWVKQVLVKDNGNILFFCENGYAFNFEDCTDIQKLIDISEKVESIYNDVISKSKNE